MAEPQLAMADGGMDDLPRTLRREREAREREVRERESRDRSSDPALSLAAAVPEPRAKASPYEDLQAAVVRHIEVPFLQLMLFFIKAVFAVIPALIILGVLLWLGGHALQSFFPQLVKMQILIRFPN